ncbi:DJ-1/PfpI family protein [Bacillus sp. SG-1]|uniref:DJ-1/PfpI family protein n=1 Tax=Bacillus sp. SG-1 TaxID=161544 RepID=UPI0005C6B061|nr:DJ-1/PfpI family protein [Bacillus sp. SG-1]
MKKTAVLLYPQFSEYELSVALSVLMQGKKPVVTCWTRNEAVRGESGLTCLPDRMIQEIDLDEIDSVLLPGCMDIMLLKDEEEIFHFLEAAADKVSVIAAISSSPYLLARAGLLKGKRYTVGLAEEARESSGIFEKENYSDELVVQDGKVLTARGRGFIEFGTHLGNVLGLSFNGGWYRC